LTQADLIALLRSCAENFNVDPDLVVAIATIESGIYPLATRFEPNWKYFWRTKEFAKSLGITEATERVHQATSWGCLQVMGAVARELGFTDQLPALCTPDNGIRMGCKKLARLSEKYENEEAIIAAYNAGSARRLPGGKWENQDYVTKVSERLRKLRAIGR